MICETTITLIEKPDGKDGYGRAKFVPVATDVPCHMRSRTKRITRGDGKETVSTRTLFLFDPDIDIGVGYRVTVNGEELVIVDRAPSNHDIIRSIVCYAAPK